MKPILILVLALLMAGCASIPQPKPPVATHKTVKAEKPKPVVVAPIEETKPATFKTRWYDRFMKHKAQ